MKRRTGTWTVLHAMNARATAFWCRCTCGRERPIAAARLDAAKPPQCPSCSRQGIVRHYKHGQARPGRRTRLWRCWWGMLQRCSNPKHPDWSNYGGRGITVCRRWQGPRGFECFREDVQKFAGRRPTKRHTLDRRNNEKGYFPRNVRWATPRQQNANRRPRP